MIDLGPLLRDPRYARMCAAHTSNEGNLLEYTEQPIAEAQAATIGWALATYCPLPRRVVETGTNKALFGLLLAHMLPPDHAWSYRTCDINPDAARAVAVLHGGPIDARFVWGPSAIALPELLAEGVPDLAWVDGDHSMPGCLTDLHLLNMAGCPLILVDDAYGEAGVANALRTFIDNGAPYVWRASPFAAADSRGIAVLTRTA